MAQKMGISLGVKLGDLQTIQKDLDKQISKLKCNLTVDKIEMDTEKLGKKVQTSMNGLASKLILKISKIDIDENTAFKSQLSRLTKDATIKISNIEINKSATDSIQGKLDSALKGLVVKVGNVEFDVTKIDTLVNKTKEAEREANKYKETMGRPLDTDMINNLKEKAIQLKNDLGMATKTSLNMDGNGGVKDATISYTDNMGKLVTETYKWKQVLETIGDGFGDRMVNQFVKVNTKITEDTGALTKLEQKYEVIKAKMQGKLDIAKSNDFVNGKGLDELQEKINAISTRTKPTAIQELQREIDNLSKSDKGISDLQQKITSMENVLNQAKSNGKDILNFDSVQNNIKSFESQLEVLKGLENEVFNGNSISPTKISDAMKTMELASKNLANSLKESKSGLNSFSSIDRSKLQTKLDSSKDNGFLGDDALEILQKRLDAINTRTPKEQIDALKNEINNLASTDKNISKIQSSITNMGATLGKIKNGTNSDIFGLDSVQGKIKAVEGTMGELRNILKDVLGGKTVGDARLNETFEKMKVLSKQLSDSLREAKTQADGLSASMRNSLQGKLTTSFNNGFINTSFLTDLQNKLNSITVTSPKTQIDSLIATINGLGKSDTNIVKLQRTIVNLSNEINKIKNNKSLSLMNQSEVGRLQTAQVEVSKLRQMLSNLQSGKVIDGALISSEVNTATNSVRQLKSEVNSIKESAFSLGGTLKSMLMFSIGGSAMFAMFNQIKSGVEWVKYLDESFTDMAITMDISRGQFDKMSVAIDDMSQKLGVNAKDVHDIARVYANASASTEQILAKIKPDAELANISGLSGEDITKTLQTATYAFDMLNESESNAGEATTHIGDVMTNVSKNMKYDFQAGIKELNGAIKTSGSVARESGMSLEQYTAYMGALIERTGKSGEELGTFWKMLTARMQQIKGLGDEMGVSKQDMGKAEKAFASVGISVRGTNGTIKDMNTLLQELRPKWENMKDQERSYVAENVAGNRHRATFLSLMKSMTTEAKLYGDAMNSSGALEEANEKRAESLDGKLNTLKDTMQVLYDTIISGSAMKGGVDLFTNIVSSVTGVTKAFGSIPTVLATVVGAMTIFNNKFRASMSYMQPTFITNITKSFKNMSDNMVSMGDKASKGIDKCRTSITNLGKANDVTIGQWAKSRLQLAGYQTQLAAATIGTKALAVATVALEAAYSMGLSLVISYVISKFMEFADAQDTLKKSNEEFIANSKSTKESLGSANELLKQKEDLEKKLNSTNEGTKENKDLKEQLLDVERQLAGVLPTSANGYDEQGKAISTNNKLIEDQIKLKKQAALEDTMKQIDKNNSGFSSISWSPKDLIGQGTNMGFGATTLENIDKSIEEYKKAKEEAQKAENEASNALTKAGHQNDVERWSKMLDEATSKKSQYRLLIMDALEAGKSVSDLAQRFGVSEDVIKSYTKDLNDNSKSTKDNGDKQKELVDKTTALSNALGELKDTGTVSQGTIDSLNKLFPNMGINVSNVEEKLKKFNKELLDNSDLVSDASKEMEDSNKLSESTIKKLADAFPELGINADNAKDILGKVADAEKKLGDEAKAAEQKVKDLGSSFSDLGNEAKVIDSIKDEMSKYGGITEETLGTVISKYPELLAVMSQGGDITKNLTDKQEELRTKQEQVKQEAIDGANDLYNAQSQADADSTASNADANATKSQNDANYHDSARANADGTSQAQQENNVNDANTHAETTGTKSQNDASYNEDVRKNASDTTNEQANQYSNDSSNFEDANKVKELNFQYWCNHIGSYLWSMVTGNKEAYDQDAQNWIDAQLKKNNADAQKQESHEEASIGNVGDGEGGELDKYLAEQEKKNKAKVPKTVSSIPKTISTASAKEMDKAKQEADKAAQKAKQEAEQAEKKAKQEAEQKAKYQEEISNMKVDRNYDQYSQLEGKVKDVDNELKINESLQKSLTQGSKDYVEAQKQEISLYAKKQDAITNLQEAYYKEQNELKNKLGKYSFYFDDQGNLTNSVQRLKEIGDSIDAMGGDSEEEKKKKQEWITWYKEISDGVKRYGDLNDDLIPKCKSDWDDLGNSVQDVNKKIQDTASSQLQTLGNDLMAGLKEQITQEEKKAEKAEQKTKKTVLDDLDNKIKKKKKELSDLEDDSSDKNIKLQKLQQQMALWKQDNSAVSVQKQSELQNEITDLEKDIQKDSLQKELDTLDEKKSAKEKHFEKVEQATKDSYDRQLEDENLYTKASKLIQDGNLEDMKKVLNAKKPDFTNIWKDLGKSSVDAYLEEIQNGLKGADIIKNLTKDSQYNPSTDTSDNTNDGTGMASPSGKASKSEKKSTKKSSGTESKVVKVGDTVKITNLNSDAISSVVDGSAQSLKDDGATWGSYVDSHTNLKVIGYDNGYFELSQGGQEIGWAKREDLAKYDTGGRVPENISNNGALAIVDKGEKILTQKDTQMTDRIFDYVEQTANMLSNVSNMLNDYNNTRDIANVSNSLNNQYNNNQTTNQGNVTIKNEFNVTNTSNVRARNTEQNIATIIAKDVAKFGKRV